MKNLFLAFAFITISTTAFSQIKVRPGVRAGANLASLSNTEYDTKTDAYFGAFASVQFGHLYTLQPEINYSRQGAKSNVSGIDDIEVQYVGFTLANKFAPFKDIGVHAIIGPTINIKVGDNIRGDAEVFDFLFFGGLGYDFPFGLGIEARYNIGFIDILGNTFDFVDDDYYEDDYYDDDYDYFEDGVVNSVFQIGVTYKFQF
ncbi:outer membrane beta-barrel protein [Psychroserpens sp.]